MFSVVLMTTVISMACKPNTDIAIVSSCVCLRISLLIPSTTAGVTLKSPLTRMLILDLTGG